MARIEISDLNEETTVTEEEIKHVKGGASTVGGLGTRTNSGYTEVEWTLKAGKPKTGYTEVEWTFKSV